MCVAILGCYPRWVLVWVAMDRHRGTQVNFRLSVEQLALLDARRGLYSRGGFVVRLLSAYLAKEAKVDGEAGVRGVEDAGA